MKAGIGGGGRNRQPPHPSKIPTTTVATAATVTTTSTALSTNSPSRPPVTPTAHHHQGHTLKGCGPQPSQHQQHDSNSNGGSSHIRTSQNNRKGVYLDMTEGDTTSHQSTNTISMNTSSPREMVVVGSIAISTMMANTTTPHLTAHDAFMILFSVPFAFLIVFLWMGAMVGLAVSIHYGSLSAFSACCSCQYEQQLRQQNEDFQPSHLLFCDYQGYYNNYRNTRFDPWIAAWGLTLTPRTSSDANNQQNQDIPTSGSSSSNPSLSFPARTTQQYDPPKMDFQQWTIIQPQVCSTNVLTSSSSSSSSTTMGFRTWEALREAVQEANTFSAERFVRWTEYWAATDRNAIHDSGNGAKQGAMTITTTFQDDALYYEKDIVFRICPNTIIQVGNRSPIVVNAENVVILCDKDNDENHRAYRKTSATRAGGCIMEGGMSHLSFGPYARNVRIRGIQFQKARSSSILVPHNGASITFEDCSWVDNAAIHSSKKGGTLANINSTSIVNFYECTVGTRQVVAAGTPSGRGFIPFASIHG